MTNPPKMSRTLSGKERLVSPRSDDNAEDEVDIAIYDARKAKLATDPTVLPKEVTAAILRGDTRLKAIRQWRNITQQQLSAKTEISQGYLSDLESTRRAGTPETSAKLAAALHVPIDWLS